VERGLSLFKTGEDAVQAEKNQIQRLKQASIDSGELAQKHRLRQGPGLTPRFSLLFTENLWGAKVRRSVKVTERLNKKRWADIWDCAVQYVDAIDPSLECDNEDGSDTQDKNDHAMVDLSW
jgi:hypothetical protein